MTQRFEGIIGRTADVSQSWWPDPIRAKESAPNVIFFVLDDTGFAHLGCYGGLVNTPNLDRLAAGGLLYNNMHTTALCSPTRSCILTGRNHHSNAMAAITEVSTGFPGSNGSIPFENGFLGEILLEHGYNTYAIGKWHLTPAEQISAAGPYNRWPTGRGFERYYGFLGGDTHQFYPEIVYDQHQVDPPKTPEEGYHFTEDMADRAIQFVADSYVVAPDKPFFMYWACGAAHAPHHVPREWIDKNKGRFDMGWDRAREIILQRQIEMGIVPPGTELSPHNDDVPAWDQASEDEKRLYVRMMEIFAGFLEHTDAQIGRVLDYLERIGKLDNTLIMVISDNGSSPEGGPTGSVNENMFFNFVPESLEQNLAVLDDLGGPKYFNHFPWGWTWAGNTPFRRWKRETYRGGISDPFLVHWPAGIHAKGEIRTQYAHAIDMVPTVLEALGIEAPESIRGVAQSPMQGISLAYSFDDSDAPPRHLTQYFEMLGHRSIYHDGWRAVCPWPGRSFAESSPFGTPMSAEDLQRIDASGWELYHVAEDFSEVHEVSGQHPEILQELITLWYVEAGKYNVLPIDSRAQQRISEPRPQLSPAMTSYIYFPDTQLVPYNSGAKVLNRPHSITADVEIPAGGAEGVLLVHGDNQGGYSFFVKNKKLHHVHNYVGLQEFLVTSIEEIPEGKVSLRYEFEPTGEPDIRSGKGTPGRSQLYINDKLVGDLDLPVTIPLSMGLGGGIVCGRHPGSPVTDAYSPPFKFTGAINSVVIDVSGDLIHDTEAQMRMVMARQ